MLKKIVSYETRDGLVHESHEAGLRHELQKAIPATLATHLCGAYAALNQVEMGVGAFQPIIMAILQNPDVVKALVDDYISARDAVAEYTADADRAARHEQTRQEAVKRYSTVEPVEA